MTSATQYNNRIWILTLFTLLAGILPPSIYAQRMPQDSWYLAKEFRGDIEGGKFHNPHDAAVGPDGNVYVCDRYNHRIQVFTQDGTFLRKWGGCGSAQGQLNEPTGIFIAADGKVYVSEAGNNRVQVFDTQGKSLQVIGQQGSGDGQLNRPHGVTVDDGGNIYVVDWDNGRIMVYKADGSYLRQWGSWGSADGQFYRPSAICRTPNNKIAVADCGRNLVQVFNSDGTFAFKFGADGDGVGQMHNTYGVKTDQAGNFYVTQHDYYPPVTVFDSSGRFIRTIGPNVSANNFNPFSLAVGNSKVFVCDWDNHRISVYTTNGNFVRNFGSYADANFSIPYGLATDAQGNIYISDSGNSEIRKYDANLNFITRFGSNGTGNGQFSTPFTLAISPDQKLYVVDRGNHRVQILDLSGNFLGKFGQNGSGDGQLNNPWGIAVGKDGRVYVADQSNHRVEIFDAQGNFLKKFGKQGGFDGQFQSPTDIVALPNGKIVVGDRGNGRLQVFDLDGEFLDKNTDGWCPVRFCASSDSLIYGAWGALGLYDINNKRELKAWNAFVIGSITELPNGDLLHGGEDSVLRIWKRTYRIAVPDYGNALPLPTIVSQKRRPGKTLVDIDYVVKDVDSANVSTALLAFQNGGNSLNDIVPIKTFAEGTTVNLGSNIPTGVTKRVTWDVAKDWQSSYGNLQLEVLAKDNRGLLNIDFLQIPGYTNATTTNPPLKISRSPLNDNDFLSVWYWLVASGDPSVSLKNGVVVPAAVSPTSGVPGLRAYYFNHDWAWGGQLDGWMKNDSYQTIDYGINVNGSIPISISPANQESSILWIGGLVSTISGTHRVYFDVGGGLSVWVNNQLVINDWPYSGANGNVRQVYADVDLQAGVALPLTIAYGDHMSWGNTRLLSMSWRPPGQDKVLIGSGNLCAGVTDANGNLAFNYTEPFAYGSTTTLSGRAFLFGKMGLREATPDEVKRSQEAGTPGVINRWAPKFQVGPYERPAAINAYGFDTGADGYWVVPITTTTQSGN